ncbi:MAG: DUF1049 domain-containing protein [Alphaproteobacteria bacterium]|nr:DUF1049 domain-containing protein [Alphaproteobacteria bacterium]
MGFIKFIIGLPLFAMLLIFATVNNDFVTLKVWPTDIEIITSLSVVIVVLVALGYFIGWLFTWMSYSTVRSALRAHKKQNKKLSKEQEKLTKEVEDLQGNIENLKTANPLMEKKSWKDKLKNIFSKNKS